MPATRKPRPVVLLALLALTACGKLADDWFCEAEGCAWSEGEWARVAALANPGAPPPDASNVFVGDRNTQSRMGQAFFFDTAFSGTATEVDAIKRPSPPVRVPKGQPLGISCATCHDLARAGVDTTSVPGHVSVGAGWTDVNALPVVNSAYRPVMFWNGRADSLWALNVIVAESPTTMNGNRLRTAHQLVDRYLKSGSWTLEPVLLAEFQQLLGRPFDCTDLVAAIADVETMPPDGKPGAQAGCQQGDPSEPFGDAFDCLTPDQQKLVTTLLVIWAKAIAAYEQRLTSVDSHFDEFVSAGPSSDAISAAAKRGARLFVGKGSCVDCHSGPQLTDELFHNIGVPQTGTAVPTTADCPAGNAACDCSTDPGSRPCAPWGAYDGISKLKASKWLRTSMWSDTPSDSSRDAYVMRDKTDLKGAWRTPSLRNVALTAPYMHDGRYATLEDVIWHYNTGGRNAGPEQVGHPAAEIKPLLLTEGEQSDLVAFLETLTGSPVSRDLATAPELPSGGDLATRCQSQPLPPPGCTGTPPPSPVITDFSDARGVDPVLFGTAPNITGGTFVWAAPGLTPPMLAIGQGANGSPALQVQMHTGVPSSPANAWLGFGMSFEGCEDATAFDAVRFTISGGFGVCPIRFALTSSQTVKPADDPRGTCTLPSCFPPSMPIAGSGTITVPFTGNSFPGTPNIVDPRSLIGIQWQMDALPNTGCDGSFTIDDIQFVRTGAGPGSGGGGGSAPTGAAGSGGTTGPTGTGGTGVAPPPPPNLTCVPMPVAGGLVTDFTDASGINPTLFGKPPGIIGRTFSYGPPGVPVPWPSLVSGGNGTPALQFVARPPPPPATPPTGWYGFGLTFDNCADAGPFNGVRFTLNNMIANCPVDVAVTSRQNVRPTDDPRGTCSAASCEPPFTSIAQSGTVTAAFSGGGFPGGPSPLVDPSALIGIQWRVPVSCGARLSIDDIIFVTQ